MRHFDKIPADDKLPAAAKACATLTELYTFRMRWLNEDASGGGASLPLAFEGCLNNLCFADMDSSASCPTAFRCNAHATFVHRSSCSVFLVHVCLPTCTLYATVSLAHHCVSNSGTFTCSSKRLYTMASCACACRAAAQ